jgi:DNA-binding transcriptional MocR family regulator
MLHQSFSALATWQSPKGGLFFWLKLNRKIDTQALLADAIKTNVAFMPGENFFPLQATSNSASFMRLNFSHASTQAAQRGLKTLAKLVKKQ